MIVQKTILSILVISFFMGLTSCKKSGYDVIEGIKTGHAAPEFTLPDVDEYNRSLSDYKGKLVLVEFWASSCSYCKEENPVLIMLHHAYQHEGFEILGVSLDTQKDKWMEGIISENLTFDHVSDLKGFDSPVAKLYEVGSIPQMFLVDENGIIICITNNAFDAATLVEQHY